MKKINQNYLLLFLSLTFLSCQINQQTELLADQQQKVLSPSKLQGGTPLSQNETKLQQIMAYNFAHIVTPSKARCSAFFRHQTQLVTAAHCFVDYPELAEDLNNTMANQYLSVGEKKQRIKDHILQKIQERKNQLRIYQNSAASNYQTDYNKSLPIQTLKLSRLYGQALLYQLYYHFHLPMDEIPHSIRGLGLIADFAYLSVDSPNPRYEISTMNGQQLNDILDYAAQSQENQIPLILLGIEASTKYQFGGGNIYRYQKLAANTYLFTTPDFRKLVNEGKAFDSLIVTSPETKSVPGDSGGPYLLKLRGEYYLAGIHNGIVSVGSNLDLLHEYGHTDGMTMTILVDHPDFWQLYDVVPYEQIFQ